MICIYLHAKNKQNSDDLAGFVYKHTKWIFILLKERNEYFWNQKITTLLKIIWKMPKIFIKFILVFITIDL